MSLPVFTHSACLEHDTGVAPFIGFIGLSVPDFGAHFLPPGQRVVEIGWRLARAFWGRGYATEGAREALRFGFAELGLAGVVSFTPPGNLRSQAVMPRPGMIRDPPRSEARRGGHGGVRMGDIR